MVVIGSGRRRLIAALSATACAREDGQSDQDTSPKDSHGPDSRSGDKDTPEGSEKSMGLPRELCHPSAGDSTLQYSKESDKKTGGVA
jgi:hypothetical protein